MAAINRPANATAIAIVGAVALAAVLYKLGFSWPRFLIVAPAFLGAAVVAITPNARTLELAVIFVWLWMLGFLGTLSLALVAPDFLSVGVLWAVSFIGWLGAVLGFPLVLILRYRQHGTT